MSETSNNHCYICGRALTIQVDDCPNEQIHLLYFCNRDGLFICVACESVIDFYRLSSFKNMMDIRGRKAFPSYLEHTAVNMPEAAHALSTWGVYRASLEPEDANDYNSALPVRLSKWIKEHPDLLDVIFKMSILRENTCMERVWTMTAMGSAVIEEINAQGAKFYKMFAEKYFSSLESRGCYANRIFQWETRQLKVLRH